MTVSPIRKASTKADMLKEIGRTGLKYSGGRVQEEFLKQLQGPNGIRAIAEMRDNDSIIGSILYGLEMLVRQVAWRVDGDEDDERKEFIESCIEDMSHSWSDFISEVLTMLPFGWSYFEIVYKYRNGPDSETGSKFSDGKLGWRKFALRAQETLDRWEFDENGGVRGMYQIAPPDYNTVFIPIEKSLHFKTKAQKGSPQGRSLLRNAYRSYYMKKNIEEIEGIGIERDAAGIPKMGVPPEIMTASDGEAAEILEAIKQVGENIKNDEQAYILFPLIYDDNGNPMYSYELLSAAGSKQFDTSAIIERYSRQIAMTVLADVILLGHERVGSLALAENKADLLTSSIEAITDSIAEVLNRHALPRLMRLNGYKLDDIPTVCHEAVGTVDIQQLADAMVKFASAGMQVFPDDNMENYVRELAGWPEFEEDEEALVPTLPTPPMTPPEEMMETDQLTEADNAADGS